MYVGTADRDLVQRFPASTSDDDRVAEVVQPPRQRCTDA